MTSTVDRQRIHVLVFVVNVNARCNQSDADEVGCNRRFDLTVLFVSQAKVCVFRTVRIVEFCLSICSDADMV